MSVYKKIHDAFADTSLFILVIILVFLLSSIISAKNKEMEPRMKTIGFIIANDIFRDEEYFDPKHILENAGFKTITIAKELKICNGQLGAKIIPDMALKDVNIENFDAIIFVGGSGSKVYWNDEKAHQICRDIISQNKVLAAICSAVATPAFAGVLKDKKVNSFESEHKILKEHGAILMKNDVIIDKNIITANGPKAAKEFGHKILEALVK